MDLDAIQHGADCCVMCQRAFSLIKTLGISPMPSIPTGLKRPVLAPAALMLSMLLSGNVLAQAAQNSSTIEPPKF